MRDIAKVIDGLIELAPELRADLERIRLAAGFTPPELMRLRWEAVQDLLIAKVPAEHARFHAIVALWSAKESER